MDSEGSVGSRATQTWLQPILSAYRCRAALSLPFPSAGVREWQWAGVFQEPAGSEWGGGQTPGLLDGKCVCCLLFLFHTPPSSWGALVQTIPQDTARDSGCPIWSRQVRANRGKNHPQPSCRVLMQPKLFL